MTTDGFTKLFVFLLQESDRLLEGFQQELLANAATLGVFTVALTATEKKEESVRKKAQSEQKIWNG